MKLALEPTERALQEEVRAFLASDDAAYFVGATLSPNGGLVTAV